MRIPKQVWEQIVEHLLQELPGEGFGVLVGTDTAVRFLKLQNTAADSAHFRALPKEWVSLFHALETTNERLLATVHSHPVSPPVPSREDIDGFHLDANMLIVSLQDADLPEPRLYKKNGTCMERCPLEMYED